MNYYLRDKQADKTDGYTIYQNPSIDKIKIRPGMTPLYTLKNQEEEAIYDHLH